MEHFKYELSKAIRAIMPCVLCVGLLSACKKPLENPSAADPIYNDLVVKKNDALNKIELQKKKIDEMAASLGKYGARDPLLKKTQHDKENLERGLVQLEQLAKYFEIRAKQRELFDNARYAKAFKDDQPWPPESDFVEYKESKRLRGSSRNWEDKVPKATQYSKPKVEEPKKKKEPPKQDGGADKPAET